MYTYFECTHLFVMGEVGDVDAAAGFHYGRHTEDYISVTVHQKVRVE